VQLSFKIEIKNIQADFPAIVLEGEVDVYTAPQLKQHLIAMLEGASKKVLIDLTAVDYLDSTALGVLIGGLKRFKEIGGDMILVCPSPRIHRVFEITGLDKIFVIYQSEADALQDLGKDNE
jgi:anti-sigma B factor antagonist